MPFWPRQIVQATARRPWQVLQVTLVPSLGSDTFPVPRQVTQSIAPVEPQALQEMRPWPRHISQVISILMRSATASQSLAQAAASGAPEESFFQRSMAEAASNAESLRVQSAPR